MKRKSILSEDMPEDVVKKIEKLGYTEEASRILEIFDVVPLYNQKM